MSVLFPPLDISTSFYMNEPAEFYIHEKTDIKCLRGECKHLNSSSVAGDFRSIQS